VGANAPLRKFFLVIQRTRKGNTEQVAIPVSGECELAESEQLPVTGKLPAYVVGVLSLQDEIIEILHVDKLISTQVLQ
jgi:chemotaxis signal transduction protein